MNQSVFIEQVMTDCNQVWMAGTERGKTELNTGGKATKAGSKINRKNTNNLQNKIGDEYESDQNIIYFFCLFFYTQTNVYDHKTEQNNLQIHFLCFKRSLSLDLAMLRFYTI